MTISPIGGGGANRPPQNPTPSQAIRQAQTPAGARLDRMHFSARITQVQIGELIVERVLTHSEAVSEVGEELFEQSGKPEFLAWAAGATDFSSQGVADRIFQGITGYIFNAFLQRNADPTPEDFAGFRSQVERGVAQGMAEAREILSSLSVLDENVTRRIDRTGELLNEKLADWFEQTAKLFEAHAE